MKKEQFFKLVLCLVTMGILVGTTIPTVSCVTSPEYWIVTDGVTGPKYTHHYFYDCVGDELWSNHTQEWNEDACINTSIDVWAIATGPGDEEAVLNVKTYADFYNAALEYVNWTIFNGNVPNDKYFVVRISWKDNMGSPQYWEVQVDINEATQTHNLGVIPELDLNLKYVDPGGLASSPGQKYYWIAFNGENPLDPDEQENTKQSYPQQGQTIAVSYPSQWWQNYSGDPEEISPIWEEGWHINHKVDFKMEEDGNHALLYVKMHSQSNFWPEWFNWTCSWGDYDDNYFQVALYDGDGNLEFNETATTSWQQIECGSLDNFTLWVQYKDPQ